MRLLFSVAGIFLTAAAPVAAQDSSGANKLELQLNRATETDDGGCQVVFFGRNGLDKELQDVTWRLAVFNKEGIFENLLTLPLGKLSTGKRRVVQFILPTACTDLAEIIVNDVVRCQIGNDPAAENNSDICLSDLSVSSRTDIAFGL